MLILHLYYILYFYIVTPAIRKGFSNNHRNIVDVGGDAYLDSGTLMIICDMVTGVSNITRQWYRDGVLQSEIGHKLTVSANSTKYTNYTCVVSNQCGKDSATTIVRSK